MSVKEAEKIVNELRMELEEDTAMKEAFEIRYRPDVDKVEFSKKPGVGNMRRFTMGAKVADYLEVQKGGLTDYVVVWLGREQRGYSFQSVLEAEVSIVDYLAGG